MKRSNMFLAAALLLPVPLTAVGYAALRSKLATPQAEQGSPIDDILSNGEPRQSVLSETISLASKTKVRVRAGSVEIRFDPALKDQAAVKVEAKSKDQINVTLRPDELLFEPAARGESMHVSLTLPATLEGLSVELEAAKCEIVASADTTAVGDFAITQSASSCEATLGSLVVNSISLAQNAGKLAMNVDSLTADSVSVESNTGEVKWTIGKLVSKARNVKKFKVASNAGKASISIGTTAPHGVRAYLKMGKLSIERPDGNETLAGLSDSRDIKGPVGSPTFELNATTGDVTFKVEKFLE